MTTERNRGVKASLISARYQFQDGTVHITAFVGVRKFDVVIFDVNGHIVERLTSSYLPSVKRAHDMIRNATPKF